MHIFISYAKRDTKDLAIELYQALNAIEGITAWMDESLEPAEAWAKQLEDEIKKADYLIVLLSPDLNREETDTQDSSFVLKEISYAQGLKKPILPVMVQQIEIPITLQGKHYIDLSSEPETKKQEILDFFTNRLGKTGHKSSPPKPATKPKPTSKNWKLTNETAMILAAIITGLFSIAAVLISQNLSFAPPTPTTASQRSGTPSSQATLTFMGDEGVFDINLLYDGVDAITIQAAAASDLRTLVLLASDTSYPLLEYFPDVLSQPLAAGDCLRFYRDGGTIPPAPRSCRGSTFELGLSNTEIFWFDSLQNQPVNIRLVLNNNSLGLCSAAMAVCRFTQDGLQ